MFEKIAQNTTADIPVNTNPLSKSIFFIRLVVMSESMPLISVVVPTYNRSKCVEHALKTVLDQTYRPIELIFVNDGSSDNTHSVLSGFVGLREGVCVIALHKSNGGVSSARNLGIKHAKGEYIAFLDDDDEWVPEKLTFQYSKILEHQADASFCPVTIIGCDGKVTVSPVEDLPCTGETTEYLQGKRWALVQSLLVRTKSLKHVGLFLEEMRRCEDTEFNIRLVATLKLANADKPLAIYNRSDDSLSSPKRGLKELYKLDNTLMIMLDNLALYGKRARWWDDKVFSRKCAAEYETFIKHRLYGSDIPNALAIYNRGVEVVGDRTLLKRAKRKIYKAKLLRLFGKAIKHPKHDNPEDIIVH